MRHPPSDVLFTRPDPPSSSCTYGVNVSINFNGFATGHTGKDFTVSVGGDNLVAPNGPNGSPNGLWTSSGFSNNDVVGRRGHPLLDLHRDGGGGVAVVAVVAVAAVVAVVAAAAAAAAVAVAVAAATPVGAAATPSSRCSSATQRTREC